MSKEIEQLQQHLEDDPSGLAMLKSIASNYSRMQQDIKFFNEQVKKQQASQMSGSNIIDCGIGKITWSADNLQLQLLMEGMAEQIAKEGPLALLRKTQSEKTSSY